jgi:hypothetical protein
VEDEGGREELLLEVDLGERVVEAAEGVAEGGCGPGCKSSKQVTPRSKLSSTSARGGCACS